MKKPIVLLLGFSLCFLIIFLTPLRQNLSSFFENQKNKIETEENDEKETGVDKQMFMWFESRAYPDPYHLNEKYMNGWLQAEAIRTRQQNTRGAQIQSGLWNSIGPDNVIGGRVLSIAIDALNGNNLFAGSAGGGIWKSTNGGTSWSYVSTGLPVLGVASIIINPSNSNIIYAGTGEVYRIDSTSGTPNPGNTGFSVWKTRGTYGIGIIKSTDGGTTWSQVLTKTTDQLFAIQTLKFDPSNSNTVYACTTDGLYRSTNSGSTWTKIFNVTYVSDVVINGTTLVAAVGNLGNTVKGIFRSTDNGSTWTKITSGLPASFQGFIKFDCLSSAPATIIASIGVSEASGVNELYRSTNSGSSWSALSNSTHTQWQYWCAHDVAINPTTPNNLVFGGVQGYNYTISTATQSSPLSIHDDVHDIKFDPSNSNNVYICGDGGVYKSTDGGFTFSAINTGLFATQFYASLGVSTSNPNLYVGGLQDNGQVVYNGTSWSTVSGVGGDGTACAIDPSNDNNMLISRDARGIYKSTNGGGSATSVASYWGSVADSRTAFCSPVVYSKSNSSIAYAGSDNLHKSTNGGGTWSNNSYSSATNYIEAQHKTAIALAVSPTNANKIYASTSCFAQYDNDVDNIYVTGYPNVLKTTTGNTPFTAIRGTGADTLPRRFIMDFAISSGNDDSVFVAVGGFGTSHVYVTGNGGTNWKAIGLGLPDVPFNAVLIDPVNPQVIYAGGDLGVYVSPNRGISWYDYNTGFWDAVQVMDLQVTSNNQLLAATHGKGLFIGPRYTGTLPVRIISFTGKAGTTTNNLQWTVAQENNLSHYELQRSSDGIHYQEIAQVKSRNSIMQTDYTYSDPATNNASYFYRLKCVNNDDSYTYSDVVNLRRSSQQAFRVLGNPFINSIELRFLNSQNTKAQINLYDGSGKLIRKELVFLNSGQTEYSVQNLNNLPPGIYFVEAIINNQRWKQKLIKK